MIFRKTAVFIVALASLVLTVLYFYRAQTYDNYTINDSQDTTVIELPNGKYFVLDAQYDLIDNGTTFSEKPFGIKVTTEKSATGYDYAWSNKQYSEHIQTGGNSRTTTVSPRDPTTIDISILSATEYTILPELMYYTQVDYSGKVEFEQDEEMIFFEDHGCSVTFDKNPAYEYVDYGNGKTIIIKRAYARTTVIDITLHIDCVR